MTGHNRQSETIPVLHTPSRREFLTKGALLAGGIMIFGLPFLTGKTRFAHAALSQDRASQAGRFALVLDGQIVGFLKSVESGFVSGSVVTQQLGAESLLKKALGSITYEDITIQCGSDMAPGFYQWIQASMDVQGNPYKNGTILRTNINSQVVEEKVFQNAIITEVAFPALDLESNEPDFFSVTFKPQQTIFQSGSGSQISYSAQSPQGAGQWAPYFFRLNIRGLEEACASITRIEPLVWKRQLIQTHGGGAPMPGRPETPNLVITLPASQADPFSQWFYNFVLQGNASDSQEKPGLLELLGPDQQQVLFTISFGNLGIFRMSPVMDANGTSSLVKVEMYCETMQFAQGQMGGSSSAQQQSAPPPSPPPRRRPSSSKRRRPRRKTR